MHKISALLILLSLSLMPVYPVITDDFAEMTLSRNLKIRKYTPKLIVDEFAESNTKHSAPRSAYVITEQLGVVKIRAKEKITTKIKPEEGSEVYFELAENFSCNGKVYPAGTPVTARIETVSMNANWGVPAEIIIGNFSVDRIPIAGEIAKTGRNKTLWVKPLAYAGTAFCGAGIFFMFIKGGHAKINPNEVFEI